MKIADVSRLREIFRYDDKEGKLFWLERSAEFCGSYKTFNKCFAHKECGYIYQGYLYVGYSGSNYLAHRICFALYHGLWPSERIDHIDGDTLNNKIENLREVSHRDNTRNAKLNVRNKTGIPGVMWDKKSEAWRVQIGGTGSRVTRIVNDFFEACCLRKSLEIKVGYHLNHGKR